MKEKNIFIKLIKSLIIIPLYYIVGSKSIFLYALSLSLYNIFLACFSNISIAEAMSKYYYNYSKSKIFKLSVLALAIASAIFTIISILLSDVISITLSISDSFMTFLFMGISIICEPFINLLLEYLESYNHKAITKYLYKLYYILEYAFLLIIGLLFFQIFDTKESIATSLLYISKILSMLIITIISYFILKNDKIEKIKKREENKINYKNELKTILTKDDYKSIIDIVKNCYYYISMIILYFVLSTRYHYAINEIEVSLSFMYFYSLILVNLMVDQTINIIKHLTKEKDTMNLIYKVFQIMLLIAIVCGIISPLLCKVIFNNPKGSIYLMMFNFMAIFIALYNITFDMIKNKQIVYISLGSGFITKIIIIIPLINSFYRMGYNLVYGDVISTIIGFLISIIINYFYLKNKYPQEKSLERVLRTLYESILLCIVLVLFQFIIPIKTDNYFMSLCLIVVYLLLSVLFVRIKNKKRG